MIWNDLTKRRTGALGLYEVPQASRCRLALSPFAARQLSQLPVNVLRDRWLTEHAVGKKNCVFALVCELGSYNGRKKYPEGKVHTENVTQQTNGSNREAFSSTQPKNRRFQITERGRAAGFCLLQRSKNVPLSCDGRTARRKECGWILIKK